MTWDWCAVTRHHVRPTWCGWSKPHISICSRRSSTRFTLRRTLRLSQRPALDDGQHNLRAIECGAFHRRQWLVCHVHHVYPIQLGGNCMVRKQAHTAVGALSCDGGATSDTLPAQGNTTIAEQNGVHPTAFAKIETFATNTTHTCTITASASVGNPFELIYAAVPPPATNATYGSWTANGPYGFIGGAPYVQNGLYTNQLNSLDALTQQLVATLHSAGWTNVQYVNLRNYLNGTTDYASVPVTLPNGLTCPASTAPPLHPNDCGAPTPV